MIGRGSGGAHAGSTSCAWLQRPGACRVRAACYRRRGDDDQSTSQLLYSVCVSIWHRKGPLSIVKCAQTHSSFAWPMLHTNKATTICAVFDEMYDRARGIIIVVVFFGASWEKGARMRVCLCKCEHTAVTAVCAHSPMACDSPLGVERYKSRAQNQRIGEVFCRYSSTSCGVFTRCSRVVVFTWCVLCE